MNKKIICIFILICTVLGTLSSCNANYDKNYDENGNPNFDAWFGTTDESNNDNSNNNTKPSEEYTIISIGAYHDGLAMISTNKGYGYIDTKGNVVIAPIYETAVNFNTLAMVKLNNKKMYINKKGKVIYTFTGEETRYGDYMNGSFWIETKEETIAGSVYTTTYYNAEGNVTLQLNGTKAYVINVPKHNMTAYDYEKKNLCSFNEYGYATTSNGFINQRGEIELFKGSYVSNIQDNFAIIDNTIYYIDFSTKTAVKAYLSTQRLGFELDIKHLGNGYYATYVTNSFNPKKQYTKILVGAELLLNLEEITEFGNAKIRDVSYYKDKQGEELLSVYLENTNGVFYSAIIDMEGNIMMSPTSNYQIGRLVYLGNNNSMDEYRHRDYECYAFSNGLCIARNTKTGLYGYVDTKGNWVIEAKYNEATDFYGEGDNAVAVVNGNTVINRNGDIIYTIEQV